MTIRAVLLLISSNLLGACNDSNGGTDVADSSSVPPTVKGQLTRATCAGAGRQVAEQQS